MLNRLLAPSLLVSLTACSLAPEVEVYAAYFQPTLTGGVGLSDGSGPPIGEVSFEDDLGLGNQDETVFAGAMVNWLIGRIEVSGFSYEDSGTGRLSADFGGIPVGTDVDSDVSIDNIKATWAFNIDLGPVRLSPGLGVDYFRVQMDVRTVGPLSLTESVDIDAPMPILYLDTAIDISIVELKVQAGGMSLNLDEFDGYLIDLDGRATVMLGEHAELMVGYRYIELDGDGDSGGQQYEFNLEISGFYVGGGLRF